MRRQADAAHQQRAHRDQHRLPDERPRHADGEQRRANGRSDELVDRDEPGLDPSVGEGKVLAPHEHRQERLRGVVGEDLRRPEHEERDQDDGDRDRSGHDRRGDQRQDAGANHVDGDDEHPPVQPVGQRAGKQAEEQRRQPLDEGGQGHEKRVTGLRGDEQRPGGDRDPVAEVADPGRPEEPPESDAQPLRSHGGDDAAHRQARLAPGAGGGGGAVASADWVPSVSNR
jgi:hypothetical protein